MGTGTQFSFIGLVFAALFAAAGCGGNSPSLPKTYPTTGAVSYKGGQPLTGGAIHLTFKDDPLLRVTGAIASDGTFTLHTMKDNARKEGAPEGEFQVTVQPPARAGPGGGVEAAQKGVTLVEVPGKVKIEAKENRLKIVLPVAR